MSNIPFRREFLPSIRKRVTKLGLTTMKRSSEDYLRRLAELHAAGIEAKAVWDKSFMDSLIPLIRVANRLKMRWKENVRSKISPGYRPLFDYEETSAIIWDCG